MKRPPRLPILLDRKIYKTGQTRGADDDVIFQNRVSRSSTVLIPYRIFDHVFALQGNMDFFESGFIVLISPEDYFNTENIKDAPARRNLFIGRNMLIFYQTREEWNRFNPDLYNMTPATSRQEPLGGHYVARVSANTSESGLKIIRGFNTTSSKGAGIRLYEYANNDTINKCRIQLESLFWLCRNSESIAQINGMSIDQIKIRKDYNLELSNNLGLLDFQELKRTRIINSSYHTICPLCLEELSAQGFFNRLEQAEGREVHDLTVTQLNLFHIEELRFGSYNHRPYNLGWGHHHCNVVVKDSGIMETLEWMYGVVNKNISSGYFHPMITPI